jgi:hypothetical protein
MERVKQVMRVKLVATLMRERIGSRSLVTS